MCKVHVTRPSGILAPFEVPELTMEQAIERNWARRAGGRLLEPRPEERLPAYPMPGFQVRYPGNWSQVAYDHYGPFIKGLV
jgi:hypothetical protein